MAEASASAESQPKRLRSVVAAQASSQAVGALQDIYQAACAQNV